MSSKYLNPHTDNILKKYIKKGLKEIQNDFEIVESDGWGGNIVRITCQNGWSGLEHELEKAMENEKKALYDSIISGFKYNEEDDWEEYKYYEEEKLAILFN